VRALREELKQAKQTDQVVMSLKHIKATEVALVLQEIYGRSKIRIAVDPITNAVIIGADEKTIAEIRKILQILDKPQERDPAKQILVPLLVPLKRTDATEAAAAINEMLGRRSDVRIAVDERTNTVIIAAPEKEAGQIKRLLETIDQPPK
jgi:type II secretory pathway component GspD/PulD (secretin)